MLSLDRKAEILKNKAFPTVSLNIDLAPKKTTDGLKRFFDKL